MSVHSHRAPAGCITRVRRDRDAVRWAFGLFLWGTLAAPLLHNIDHAAQHGHSHAQRPAADYGGFNETRARLRLLLGQSNAAPPSRYLPAVGHAHPHGSPAHSHDPARGSTGQEPARPPEDLDHGRGSLEHLGVAIQASAVFALPAPDRVFEGLPRPTPPSQPPTAAATYRPQPRAPPVPTTA